MRISDWSSDVCSSDLMQCIAGVHYNFSLPEALWEVLDPGTANPQERRSRGYIGLIRNFTRYSWLLMYLFGAAPALSRGFMEIGRASCRERVCQYGLISGVAVSLKKKNK